MNKKIASILLTVMIILFLTACSGEGIFYQIQNEVKINDNSLPNIKFLDVHNTNPAGAAGYYIARGVKLWYRSKALNSSWTKIDLPAGADAIQSSAMYNGDFYYTVKTGDSAALYKIDNVNTNGPSVGALVFTEAPSDHHVFLQLFSNEESGQDRIFMNRVDYNSDGHTTASSLSFHNAGDIPAGGLANTCTTTLNGKPLRTKGMAFGTGGNAWLIFNDDTSGTSGGHLYFSSNNFTGVNTEVTAVPDGWYEALYGRTIGTDLVLVSAKTDTSTYKLFSNANASGAGTWATPYTGDAFLSCFAWADSLVGNTITAGTKKDSSSTTYAKGIYLVNASNTTSLGVSADGGALADYANYNSSDLKNSSIYGIMVDNNAASTTAVLTATAKDSANGGVWFLNGTTRIWNHE